MNNYLATILLCCAMPAYASDLTLEVDVEGISSDFSIPGLSEDNYGILDELLMSHDSSYAYTYGYGETSLTSITQTGVVWEEPTSVKFCVETRVANGSKFNDNHNRFWTAVRMHYHGGEHYSFTMDLNGGNTGVLGVAANEIIEKWKKIEANIEILKNEPFKQAIWSAINSDIQDINTLVTEFEANALEYKRINDMIKGFTIDDFNDAVEEWNKYYSAVVDDTSKCE